MACGLASWSGGAGAEGPAAIAMLPLRFSSGLGPTALLMATSTELPFPFSPLLSVLAAWWWASEFLCRKAVEPCDTCIHWLLLVVIYKVNDLFVFLSGYWMDSPLQVEIVYFFFWVSECACVCVEQCKKIQFVRNVQSRKWNMRIPAIPTSFPRLPTANNLELESYLIKLSWLLILFTLEWVLTLWDLSHLQVTFPNLDL